MLLTALAVIGAVAGAVKVVAPLLKKSPEQVAAAASLRAAKEKHGAELRAAKSEHADSLRALKVAQRKEILLAKIEAGKAG